MYNPPVVNEYIMFEYTEILEYIPEPPETLSKEFQWNPIDTTSPSQVLELEYIE